MTHAPHSLTDLAAFWTGQGGVNLGIVADQRHCSGYHLGRDRIFSNCACRPDGTCEPGLRDQDYSVQLGRDRSGLTDASSAIDLGKLGGSITELRKFSNWLVAQCQKKANGFSDVREIIYSPDGVRVQRYSGVDGLIHTGQGNGDMSHLAHTHISYFRDSELRDKRPLFRPYFQLPDTSTEENVSTEITILPYGGGTFVIPANTEVTGFKLDGPGGAVGTKKTWSPHPDTSSAHYDATMVTSATKGDPFLRVVDGFFAGFYVAASVVVEEANKPPATSDVKHPVEVFVAIDGKTPTSVWKGSV